MCGIAGFIDFKKQSSEEILQNITRTMEHRGPDGEGYYLHNGAHAQVGFGHKRLSIIDLSSGGTQPMHYKHLTILLNGEIYNYNEIKQELIQLGHTFLSTSDTEVTIHAYEQWGEDFVHKLIGMFAIVIHNKVTESIIAFRDRAGVKPFYYYWQDDLFLFTSELKAFYKHPRFIKEVNPAAVANFLQFGYVSAPNAIFKNTYKLQQGHKLTLNLLNKNIAIKQYWNVYDYYNKPKLDISFENAVDETEKILTTACQYRMVADVPVGVFLSGGYDSTCVATLIQKNQTEKLKTFTIGVGDEQLNEAPFAKQIAKYLGTEHTEHYCTQQDVLNMVESLPYYYDEPFADSSALPTMLVSKIARNTVTVSLSADAGDEVFAGYNRYDYANTYLNKIKKIPAPLRKLGAAILDKLPPNKIPILKNDPLIAYRIRKIKELIKNPDINNLMHALTAEFYTDEVAKLIKEPYTKLHTLHTGQTINQPMYDDVSMMMAIDYETYLPDDIMQKVDRATMSVSLEGREPFLDHKVIEWAAQLPTNYKYNNGNKKHILKAVVHKHIPREMMERPKMGFAIPISKWLVQDLKQVLMDNLNVQAINKYGILNSVEVMQIVTAFVNGKEEYVLKVWYLLMFQMWCKKWL